MHDLKVKLTDLELLCLRFTLKFLGPHYFKIHFCTIPTPMHDLKVKVTDLELLY